MKKIYNFLALMLFFVAGSLSAFAADEERDWTIWDISENQIDAPANGMKVVLQQGNYSGWSKNGYLNPSGSFLSAVDATCVYELVEVGTAEDGSPLFVLRNVSNKQYIYSGGHTLSYGEAFQCTIKRADASGSDIRAMIYNGGERQPGADGVNWVFCGKDLPEDGSNPTYLAYWGCPAYSTYSDTNDWKVYEAKSHEPSSDDKLETIYNEVFKNGFPGVEYVVGTDPACISQDLYDRLQAAYNEASNALGESSVSDDKKEEIVATLVKLQKELNNGGRVVLQEGKYYMFINQRSNNGMYDNGGSMKCTANKGEINNPPTLSDARYIWSVIDAGDGKYYIQNYYTGRYCGSQGTFSSTFPTTENMSTKCIVTFNPNSEAASNGLMFYITDNSGNMWHNDASNNVVRWQSKDGIGCSFAIKEVSADLVSQLKEVVEKGRFMGKYNNLISEAKSTSTQYLYDSDVTFDDQYAAEGLVTSFEAANATETSEGKPEYAFDGNVNTYYHTLWSGNKDGEYHWVQVNFGEEPIQKLFVKFTQRHNNRTGNPNRIALVAPAATDDPEGAWTDTLYKDTVIYQYTTTFSTGTIPNTTAVIRVDLGKPVTQLRFVGLQTPVNSLHGLGPCWHVSELRFYKDGGDNPRYAMIPQEIRDALANAITNAEELASDSSATQADYEALEAAIKAFNDAYPDDSELDALLKDAKTQAEAEGMVGTGWGYFPADAQSGLAATVNEVTAYKEANSPLTLSAIAEQLAKLRAAISTFNSKLIVPEDGVFVKIKSVSVNDEGEENDQYGNYVYASNADTTANIVWGYKDDENQETRMDAVWQFQKQADGSFAIKNIVTGRYIANVYDGVEDKTTVGLSQTTKSTDKAATVTLVSGNKPGIFDLQLTEGRYLNAAPGGTVTNWSGREASSLFELEQVSSSIIESGLTYDVKKGVLQVVTLPFEAAYVAPSPYKVLGQKDGKLQLKLYSDDEVIPAGTPFIVMPEDETDYIQVGFAASDADELVNGTYEYGHVEQQGLTGTLNALTLNAGLGLLLDGVVKNSVKNTSLAAGSGYFVEIPATDEDGDLAVEIQETINGINNAVISNAKTGAIYTISGVKVRNAQSVEGLPKGLYIVNGKKVYVK